MLNLKSLAAATAALTLFSGASAGVSLKRNEEPAQPSCTNFTPFVYAGCFQDPSSPRALLYNSNLPTQNMTVEICVAFCKGNDYEYAGLEYYGECFCGASVNGPQIAESNCNFPCTGNSSESCGGNDIISIYQDPTFKPVDDSVISDYMPLGCYSEGTSGRSLAWRQDQLSSTTLTVEECLFACKDGGYSFAGVEYGSECYCGVVLGNGTLPIASTTCNMACSGNSTETCGGPSALDLYVAKDLESTEPCGYVPPVSSSTISTSTSTTSSTPSSPPTTSTTSTTSTSPTTSKPAPSTTTPPSLPTTSSTKTTASLCTSTITVSPTPSCEYQCGNWCSNPIPPFTDQNSCFSAVAACSVQVASCFLHAGFPESLNCFEFSSWCTSVSSYCGNYCPGNSCSKSGCKSKYPPSGPSPPPASYSTTVYTCPVTSAKPTTSSSPSTTSCVPVPTASNICSQPHNPPKGYSSSSPVGSIPLPCLTCNNLYSDYKSGNCFKLYTSPQSSNCPSYGRSGNKGPGQGCKDACDNQYNSCTSTYAQGCKNNNGRGGGDTYQSAMTKCQNQWNDCYSQNQGVSGGNRCNSWNQGWS